MLRSNFKRGVVSEFRKNNTGFTLSELLVVIGIIIVMTAVIVPNLRLGNERLALQRASQKVGQDIGRAIELTLRFQDYNCNSGSIAGYGVYFDINSPTTYLLFADCNDNQKYDSGQDGIIEVIELESDIQITALSINPEFSVVFIPPEPQVYFNPGNSTEAQVTIQNASGGPIKVIKMNDRGLIDID